MVPGDKKQRLSFVLFLIGLLWVSCNTRNEKLFTKLDSGDTGIDFINQNHETELSNILTYEYFYNGGGVSLGDINNDGLTDIYFTSNIFENKLYLNKGNLEFEDITKKSGVACEVGWKTGVTMADVNGDGWLDIYVCRSASPNPDRRKNILLINNGNLTFTDHAKEHGLDDSSYSTQSAFFDYDNDGDLDMVLLNHSLLDISNSFNINVKNSNVRFPDVGNKLYRNDNGYFNDVSDDMGVYGSAFNYGLGISLSDINNDGWIDVYLGSDYTGRDKMLINEQGKFFRDVIHEQLSHISKFTMGTDIADVNGDGLMDILTLDMLPEDNYRQKQLMGVDGFDVHTTMVKNGLHSQYMRNMLHLNNGNGTFSEIGQLAGISNTDWSWGGLIQDFDNDGHQDIFISNGFKRDLTNNDFAKYQVAQEVNVAKKAGKKISMLDEIKKFHENKLPNYIFKGNGNLAFANVTKEWGLDEPLITNGIAYADLDNDGDLDLVTNNMNDEAVIYRNNSEMIQPQKQFISVQLRGFKNKQGVGARVSIFTEAMSLVKEQLPVRGFQSMVDNRVFFGLGLAKKVDSIIVQWPGGMKSVVRYPAINTNVTVEEKDLRPVNNQIEYFSFFTSPDTLLSSIHENDFVDFNTQALLPRMYSRQGPALAVGDVNGDGLNDVYVGSPKGSSSKLLVQNKLGQYEIRELPVFHKNISSEEIDAIFFDMDADGDLDLYSVTGGYEFDISDVALQDILYENDGRGNFKPRSLPALLQSGSCVRVADIDNDNDWDLFIGGRIIPGSYPETPSSYILLNDGKGNFMIDMRYTEAIKSIGMVTDAEWLDLNGDKWMDLIVTGEWMPIKIFINGQSGLSDQSTAYIKGATEGFWNDILAEDFDGDGDEDLVVGNYGLNNQMRATVQQPVTLYYSDFDKNGSSDPILSYFINGNNYPYPTRDELLQQIPAFKKRFIDYNSYSVATITKVLTPEELKMAQTLTANQLQTCYFQNEGTHFDAKSLPVEFQFAPIYTSVAGDFNSDGNPDIIASGNLAATRARTGRLTGNYGLVALGDGKGNFKASMALQSGLFVKGDVRHMIVDNHNLIIAINDKCILRYKNVIKK